MKSLIAIAAITLLCFSSCRKSSQTVAYMNNGMIDGPNYSMVACGGSFWISIFKNPDTILAQFDSLPANSGINLSTATFPINVKINWHLVKGGCDSIVYIDGVEKID